MATHLISKSEVKQQSQFTLISNMKLQNFLFCFELCLCEICMSYVSEQFFMGERSRTCALLSKTYFWREVHQLSAAIVSRDNMKMYFSKGLLTTPLATPRVRRLEVLIASTVVVSLLLGCVWSGGHTKLLMTRELLSDAVILHEWLVNWTLDLQVYYVELCLKVNVYEHVRRSWKHSGAVMVLLLR